jgi:toxin ParE1/3/4
LIRVLWTEPALLDLQAIRDYIAQFNPSAAEKVAVEILETADMLCVFPDRGRPVPGTMLREMMSSYPYIIRYRASGEEVVILRLRHMAKHSA